MSLFIRPFQPADREAVVAIWQRCNLTVPWNDPVRDINRKLSVQAELFLVGMNGEELIATAMGGYDGHRGSIYYLAVDPDFRYRGFGRLMLDELENQLRALGCPKVNLMVRTANREIIDFYHHLGYSGDEVVNLGKRLVKD